MKSYCLKCGNSTDTQNEKIITTKNGRKMMTGTCAVCGTKKAKFIKN